MRRKVCLSCAIFSKKVNGEKKMRTKEVPLIPRAGSTAMGTFNSRVEKKSDRKPRVVNVRKVLATSGIVRGEIKRVKEEPVKVKEEVWEPQPPKMTETELRMADYLQAAEKVVNPPEEDITEEIRKRCESNPDFYTKTIEIKCDESKQTSEVVAQEPGLSIDEPKPALVSEERMSRRKKRKMKREAMLKAMEESMTVETA